MKKKKLKKEVLSIDEDEVFAISINILNNKCFLYVGATYQDVEKKLLEHIKGRWDVFGPRGIRYDNIKHAHEKIRSYYEVNSFNETYFIQKVKVIRGEI